MLRRNWLLLALALPALPQGPFVWKDAGNGHMDLLEAGKPVLTYNYGPQLKPGAPENRRRCCYVFPLYTPAGVSLLDDFPADHYHHRGLFWSWPIVETGGKQYDLWMNLTAKHRPAKTPAVSSDSQAARLEAGNFWEADGRDIVRERVRLAVRPAAGASRELDVELTWEALGAPVTLQGSAEQGKSYGGLSVRFAPREGTIVRADGEVLKRDEDLNPRRWAELEAVYGGRRAVLRVTADSQNPGAPHQWCLRNYGFIGASFPGRTAVLDRYTLEPGKPLTLRFRVRLSDLP
ncbi:MAG: PmoA family protein [Bryobacterales bacterium]|nr:PmoA family protein [Bryobacterales bacterium]